MDNLWQRFLSISPLGYLWLTGTSFILGSGRSSGGRGRILDDGVVLLHYGRPVQHVLDLLLISKPKLRIRFQANSDPIPGEYSESDPSRIRNPNPVKFGIRNRFSHKSRILRTRIWFNRSGSKYLYKIFSFEFQKRIGCRFFQFGSYFFCRIRILIRI